MADQGVAIRAHLIVEILLGGEILKRACLSANETLVGRVADPFGYRDNIFSEIGDGDQALIQLEGRIQDIVDHNALRARHLDFGL